MDKNIKILCVCEQGINRSTGTKFCLNQRGYKNVIAMGISQTTPEMAKMLCDWADMILLAKPYHRQHLPDGNLPKIREDFTIGEDTFHKPITKELIAIVNPQLDKIGLI